MSEVYCYPLSVIGNRIGNKQEMVEQPFYGLLIGTIVFFAIIVVVSVILAIAFRKKQPCYAVTFACLLLVMAYIMWMCTYMSQMFPLVVPEKTEKE